MSRCLQWTIVALAASAAACAAEATIDADLGTGAWSIIPDPTCDDFICGGNSPTIGDGAVFDELNSNGQLDMHNVRIASAVYHDPITLTDVPVKLVAERDRLTAVTAGGMTYQNSQLIHLEFWLQSPKGTFDATITEVSTQALHFWANDPARPGDHEQFIQFYRIVARQVGSSHDQAVPLCRQDVSRQPDWGPIWAPVEHSAIVFEADRYNPQTKIVQDANWSTPWFNLACAGTAPAKMHLMRYTNAGSFAADATRFYATGTRERQAMLKMFTADYCGTGQAFTVDGQPLIWWEAHHWYDEATLLGGPRPVASVEALWDETGALCLTTTRMTVPWVGPATTADEVRKACPSRFLPPCPATLTGWESYAKVLTLNPVFP